MKKSPKVKENAVESTGSIDYALLNRIVDRAYYLALQMIHLANNRPEKEKGEPKVGGHPSACASSKHILGAIHLVARQPEDYFACKPHVSPMDHGYHFLLRNFREADGSPMPLERRKIAMKHLRHYSREGEPVFQSYHADADPDSFRYFPSGSVGIPPVNALYTALGYRYAEDHGFELDEDPTFWCLMGDSEFREGSLMEAMPDAGERELGNVVWIVDYNRQNLDGTRAINEKALGGSDADRIMGLARANGWEAVELQHGSLRQKLFALPGGDEFQRVLEQELSDFELQAMLGANDPALTRKVLVEKSKKLAPFLKGLGDQELQDAFFNLGGHDLPTLVEAFRQAKTNRKKPTLIVAYTIKGHGLRCAAQSGNHSAMPEEDEIVAMAKRLGVSFEDPFQEFEPSSPEAKFLDQRGQFLNDGIATITQATKERREKAHAAAKEIAWPEDFAIGALKFAPFAHTQWMWGQIAAKLDRLAHDKDAAKNENDTEWQKVSPYFVTMAPDVGSSTNTSPNMNGKLYGDIGQEDFEAKYKTKDEKAPDVIPNLTRRTGHLRFEIAEGNCMSAAGSIGKFKDFVGVPFYPAMPIYDFFIKRAHDQFYYNLYWHSAFATVGTPSGITLAPEGAQHSWKSDFQIPNCVTWEPCFAKELEWILADTLRRHFTGDDENREAVLLRLVTKGLVQKQFTERLKAQTRFQGADEATIFSEIRKDVLEGGYALVDYRDREDYRPGDNAVHLFSMAALVPEALKASDALLEKGVYGNVFVVTSPDLLLGNFAYQNGYRHLKERLGISGDLYFHPDRKGQVESEADWFYLEGSRVPIVSAHDGEPGLLDNIGSIVGAPQKALAVRKTSKSGTTWDVFHYHHLDAEGILAAVEEALTEVTKERLVVGRNVLEGLETETGVSTAVRPTLDV